jgi:uncharacterized protein YbjQ (UPF0145 family)
MAVDVDYEDGKVLSSDLKYIENEGIDALRCEDGRITVLSKKSGKGFMRVYDIDNGEWEEEKSYKLFRKRDGLLWTGSICVPLFSGFTAFILKNPAIAIPALSGVYIPFSLSRLNSDSAYNSKIDDINKANSEETTNNLKNEVKGINVYQGSIEEIEKQIGRELQLVDTGPNEPRKFVEAIDSFWLSAIASGLGANAIVNFQSGSPAKGTPVKFVDKK